MKHMTTTAFLIAPLFATALSAQAQTPAEAPAPVPAAAAPAPVAPASIAIGTRVGLPPSDYQAGDRRDPFASLLAVPVRANDPASGTVIKGLPGLALADVTVRGVVKSGPSILAILEGPNKQSFVARPNDRLRDALVQTIDAGGVVFAEEGGHGMRPISVRKTIRPAGEGIQ